MPRLYAIHILHTTTLAHIHTYIQQIHNTQNTITAPERKPAPKIPGLWDAKLKARAFSDNYGYDSVEAKLAWEDVEEIASSGLSNSMGGMINEDQCDLIQAAEACMALEELDRFFTNYYATNNSIGSDDGF
jgi:hypothetical protein